MKNDRNFRLTALLLVVIMVISILPIAANAESVFTLGGKYIFNATDIATISYASNGAAVSNIADMDPNKINTMTISVPANDGLPKDKTGVMAINIPENVVITNAFADDCEGEGISCIYKSTTRQLEFKWTGKPKAGFTATLQIRTSTPATRKDVSGVWVLVVKNKSGMIIVPKPELKKYDNTVMRLTAVEASILYDCVYRSGTDLPEWKIERVTGDWYTISNGGLYLNYGKNGNNVALSTTPQYFRYAKFGAGEQFVGYDDNGTQYYLNNKSNKVDLGVQASTYDDQQILLYKELKASEGTSLVVFNVNGGTADKNLVPLVVEKGEAFTFPEYKGTKKGNVFIGWASRNNIKNAEYTQIYQPGDTLVVNADTVDFYAAWSSTTPERSQFGIRMSGDIPDEPAQHDAADYSKQHVYIDGTVKVGKWVVDTNSSGQAIEGNHIVNSVTANLLKLPTDEEMLIMYPNYDPETMYVHWYVLKYAGGMWKVDGVIVRRDNQVEVRYDANVATENKSKIKNIPATYKIDSGSTITIGTGLNGKKMKLPEYPDYIFKGWNTMADGSGQAYDSNTVYTANENVTFYAQWEKIPTYKVIYESADIGTKEYNAGDTVVLPRNEEIEDYIFAGWFMDGERITGSEFVMPAEDVEISSVYYGPIDVEIESDWKGGKVATSGLMITLTGTASNKDNLNLDYAYQWQYKVNGSWVDLEGATNKTITFELNEETAGRIWRVIVTDAWLHQD